MDKRSFINSIKNFLGLEEFKAVGIGSGSVSLLKNNTEILITYLKYPGVFRFRPVISGYVSFPEIENILKPFYKEHNIGLQNYTIYKQSRRFEHLSSIDIYETEDIEKVGKELRAMIFEDILPFFDEYQNIGQVMSKVDSLPKEDISRFVYTDPVPRVMILKKLNKTPDWKEFCEWAVGIYKIMASGPNGKQHEATSLLVSDLYAELQQL